MSNPDTNETISDGALGFAAADVSKIAAALGICTLGVIGLFYAFTDPKDVVSNLGSGPLVEDLCHSLDVAGGTVYATPIAPSAAGSVGTVTQTGTGPLPTFTGNPVSAFPIKFKIVKGGVVGTATFQISYDGGTTFGPETMTAASVVLGEGLSNKAVVSTGTTPPVITLTGTPYRALNLRIECTLGGALLTWTGRWSVDGGATWTAFTSAATVLMAGTGVTLNIAAGTANVDNVWTGGTEGMKLAFTAGTYVAGEVYSATCKQAAYSTVEMAAAFDVLAADSRVWNLLHLVGIPDGASDALKVTATAAMAAALQTKLDAVFLAHRNIRAIMDGPDLTDSSVGDTAMITGIANTVAVRVGIGADFAYIRSQVSKRVYLQSAAWVAVAQARKLSLSTDLGEVLTGRLHSSVVGIRRDEGKREGFNDARLITLRTYLGKAGFYITKPKMLAAAGSDFELLQHGRIIDVAVAIARVKGLDLISKKQRTNPNGTIFEIDARAIEREINSALDLELRQAGHVQATSVYVRRDDNILSTKKIRLKVRARPYAYPEFIETELGFEANVASAA